MPIEMKQPKSPYFQKNMFIFTLKLHWTKGSPIFNLIFDDPSSLILIMQHNFIAYTWLVEVEKHENLFA